MLYGTGVNSAEAGSPGFKVVCLLKKSKSHDSLYFTAGAPGSRKTQGYFCEGASVCASEAHLLRQCAEQSARDRPVRLDSLVLLLDSYVSLGDLIYTVKPQFSHLK